MGTTPDLGIPELSQAQANPDITHNEALVLLQAIMLGVLSQGDNVPPVSPTEGDGYIVGTVPTGAWAGRPNCIATYWGGSWRFVPGNNDSGSPITMTTRQEGLRVWVRDEGQTYVWAGSPIAWVPALSGQVNASDLIFTNSDRLMGRDDPGGGVGAEIALTGGLEFTGSASIRIAAGGVTSAMLRDSAAVSVVGRSANTSGVPADIIAAANDLLLTRIGNVLAFTQLNAGMFPANVVADAALRQSAGVSVVGRSANTTGNVADITAGANDRVLARTGNALSFVQLTIGMFIDNVITAAKLAATGQYKLFGRSSSGAGAGEEISSSADVFTMLGQANNAGILSSIGADSKYVDVAGDTMTGPLEIGQTTTGTGITDAILRAVSTDPGAAGPIALLYHNSASPAVNDVIGLYRFYGKNSGGTAINYGSVGMTITDPTAASEDSRMSLSTLVNGTLAARMRLEAGVYHPSATGGDKGDNTLNYGTFYEDGTSLTSKYAKQAGDTFTGRVVIQGAFTGLTNTDAPLTLTSTDAGANGPAFVTYHNSASPASQDRIGAWRMYGKDSAGNDTIYAAIQAFINDPVDGSEDADIRIGTMVAGTFAGRFRFAAGFFSEGRVDEGAGTINATTLYENDVSLAAKYAALAGATFVGTVNLNRNTAAVPASVANHSLGPLVINGSDGGANATLTLFGHGGPPFFLGARGNGTGATPTTIASNDYLYYVLGGGYDGTQWISPAVGFAMRATENWAAGANGAGVMILTVPNGTASGANRWFFADDGCLMADGNTKQGAGSLNPDSLYVESSLVVDNARTLFKRAYTVGTLPAAASNTNGGAMVSDALAPTFGATVVGSGAVRVPVYSDGTNWKVG